MPKSQKAFMGINLYTILHKDLQQCKQVELNNGKPVTLTVPDFNSKFLMKIMTLTDLTHTDIAVGIGWRSSCSCSDC